MYSTSRGMLWSFLDLTLRQGLTLLIQILLARLLLPQDFGLIGMVTIFIMLSHVIVTSGFDQALIREEKLDDLDLSTIFFSNIVIAFLIYIVIYFFSPFVAGFYNEPELIQILRVMMLIVIINAFTIIQRVILIRKIDFKLHTRITVYSVVLSGIVAIIMAYNNYGVWSLVAQQIIMQGLLSILLFYHVRWVPKFKFSLSIFRYYFNFGYKLLISGFIDAISQNTYNIIIGRLYGSVQLGFYSHAQKISSITASTVSQAVQRVSYTQLSKIKNDKDELLKSYNLYTKVLMFLYFPLVGVLVITAPEFIPLIFGEQWLNSVIFFQFLFAVMLFYPVNLMAISILKVLNRTDMFLKLNVMSLIIQLIMISIALILNFTFKSVLIVILLHPLFQYILYSYFSNKIAKNSNLIQWKYLIKYLLPTLIITSVGLYLGYRIDMNYLINFTILVFYSLISYFIVSFLIFRTEIKLLLKILNELKESK